LNYLGKRKEKLRIRGKAFPGSTHKGSLVITIIQVNPARGSTRALETRGDLHSQAMETMEEV
jgi:hypothetical protein